MKIEGCPLKAAVLASLLLAGAARAADHYGRTAAGGEWTDANWNIYAGSNGIPPGASDWATVGRDLPPWVTPAAVTITNARTVQTLWIAPYVGATGTLNIDNTGGGGAALTLGPSAATHGNTAYLGVDHTGVGGGAATINLLGSGAQLTLSSAGAFGTFLYLGGTSAGAGAVSLTGANTLVTINGNGSNPLQSGLVLQNAAAAVNVAGAGAGLQFNGECALYVRNGASASWPSGAIRLNAGGKHLSMIMLDTASGTFTQNQDIVVDAVHFIGAAGTARYTLTAGRTLTVGNGYAAAYGLWLHSGGAANEYRGVGVVNNGRATTGGYFRSGRIVADGSGTEGTLQFNRTVAGPLFTFDAENPAAGATGFYAENKGRLELPTLTVTNAIAWGDDPDDAIPDLVNSVRLANWSGLSTGTLDIALLATNRTSDLPAGLANAIGIWKFTPGSLGFASVDLAFRYDHALAATNGIAEALLKVFHHDGIMWHDMTTSIDTNNHLALANGVTSFSTFAVATFAGSATNRAPRITSGPAVALDPVQGATGTVSVAASDPDDDPLTFTWSRVSGPGAVAFAPNAGTNAATSTATFARGGTYTLQVSVTDGGLFTNCTFAVTVNQDGSVPPTITAGPAATPNPTVTTTATVSVAAYAFSVNDALTFTWSQVSGPGTATFTPNGTASATNSTVTFSLPGPYTLRVQVSDGLAATNADLAVTVNEPHATVGLVDEFNVPATAEAVPYPANILAQIAVDDGVPWQRRRLVHQGISGTWSNFRGGGGELWTDNYGGSSIYYVQYGTLAGAPGVGDLRAAGEGFRVVLNNNTPTRGAGHLTIEVWDADGGHVATNLLNVASGTNDIAFTQFPGINFRNVDAVQASLYVYPTVDYSQFSVNRFAEFGAGVPNTPPAITAGPTATPNPVTGMGTNAALSVAGTDAEADPLRYTWSVVSGPTNAVFAPNGSGAAANSTVQFMAPGDYVLEAAVYDGGYTVRSNLSVTVPNTLTAVTVAPPAVVVVVGDTVPFSASVVNQFGQSVNTAIVWSVSGGGTISTSGVFTAGVTPGGPFTVTATAGSLQGSASVTVSTPFHELRKNYAYTNGPVLANYDANNAIWEGVSQDQWWDSMTQFHGPPVTYDVNGKVTGGALYTKGVGLRTANNYPTVDPNGRSGWTEWWLGGQYATLDATAYSDIRSAGLNGDYFEPGVEASIRISNDHSNWTTVATGPVGWPGHVITFTNVPVANAEWVRLFLQGDGWGSRPCQYVFWQSRLPPTPRPFYHDTLSAGTNSLNPHMGNAVEFLMATRQPSNTLSVDTWVDTGLPMRVQGQDVHGVGLTGAAWDNRGTDTEPSRLVWRLRHSTNPNSGYRAFAFTLARDDRWPDFQTPNLNGNDGAVSVLVDGQVVLDNIALGFGPKQQFHLISVCDASELEIRYQQAQWGESTTPWYVIVDPQVIAPPANPSGLLLLVK